MGITALSIFPGRCKGRITSGSSVASTAPTQQANNLLTQKKFISLLFEQLRPGALNYGQMQRCPKASLTMRCFAAYRKNTQRKINAYLISAQL